MTISKVPNVGQAVSSGGVDPAKQKFGKVLEGARPGPLAHPRPSETGLRAPSAEAAQANRAGAQPVGRAAPGTTEVRPGGRVDSAQRARAQSAAQVLDQVSAAQQRLEQVLQMAQSGKTFTPAELIALQANVYRASQELDLAGKVVEKATSGVKQVLQTQI